MRKVRIASMSQIDRDWILELIKKHDLCDEETRELVKNNIHSSSVMKELDRVFHHSNPSIKKYIQPPSSKIEPTLSNFRRSYENSWTIEDGRIKMLDDSSGRWKNIAKEDLEWFLNEINSIQVPTRAEHTRYHNQIRKVEKDRRMKLLRDAFQKVRTMLQALQKTPEIEQILKSLEEVEKETFNLLANSTH